VSGSYLKFIGDSVSGLYGLQLNSSTWNLSFGWATDGSWTWCFSYVSYYYTEIIIKYAFVHVTSLGLLV